MRVWLFALVLAGCGVDRNIDDQITIQQGVYGLLVSGDHQPDAGEHVMVYLAGENHPHANVTSDGDGVYQIELQPGTYTLCTNSCTPLSVPVGKVRYDWMGGPGGGTWNFD